MYVYQLHLLKGQASHMKNLLVVDVSPSKEGSSSRHVSHHLLEKLKKEHTSVLTRDLASEPIPHLTPDVLQAYMTPLNARTAEQKQLLAKPEQLIDEVLAADTIVLSTPMWNFGPPSVLKAWIDHIVRAGRTFSYGPEGLKGLAGNKKAYIVVSSGSLFSSGPMASMDSLTPALKAVFNFIGVQDVEIIRVEGTNDPTSKANAISNALNKIEKLVS